MNLKELSESLGLSQTTVSRALNGYPEVSAKTRQRVEQAAKNFNYSPSNRAKALATGRALAIGHVITDSSQHEMVNPVFGDFIAGAGETYAKHGYEMNLSIVSDEDEEAMYRGLKSRRAVDGVVVHAPRLNDPRIPLLQQLGLPFAVHGRVMSATARFTSLDVQNQSAFRDATEYLLSLGHRRIGLINGLEEMDFAYRRREGYIEALRANQIMIDPEIMAAAPMTELLGYSAAKQMLDSRDPPTAFLVSSFVPAIGTRRAIEESGLVMGRDVSVITHDDALSYLQNSGDLPIFTATYSSVRAAGRELAEMLLHAISNPDEDPQQKLLKADLIIGRSTGPAPHKK